MANKDSEALNAALRYLAEKKSSIFFPTSFCGALEGSIKKLDPEIVPMSKRTPEERTIHGGRREIQHRRIVKKLIDQLGLNELVENRVTQRHAIYLSDAFLLGEPEPKREDRYISAREWVINDHIRKMSVFDLKKMAESAAFLLEEDKQFE